MFIKKIFMNSMIVLCVIVIIFSVITVVNRNSSSTTDTEITQDLMENEEIVWNEEDSESIESTEPESTEELIETKICYTIAKVNVRKGPATTYEKVVELSVGTQVAAVGEVDENGWQKILHEGQEAYILARYIGDEVPVQNENAEASPNDPANNNENAENTTNNTAPVVTPPAYIYIPPVIQTPPSTEGNGNTPPSTEGNGSTTPPSTEGSGSTTPPSTEGNENTTPPSTEGSGSITPPSTEGNEDTTPPSSEGSGSITPPSTEGNGNTTPPTTAEDTGTISQFVPDVLEGTTSVDAE